DITALFCEVDDFCQQFEQTWSRQPQLPSMPGEKRCRSRLKLSEVMTIVIAFHCSGFRTFKDFYTLCVRPHWHSAFPNLVSYTRFVELMPWCLMLLCCFLAIVIKRDRYLPLELLRLIVKKPAREPYGQVSFS
ncbi:MAG: hypothetical protein WCD18_24100, partial [Thermosynechococcaceae cyanobacterium]